MRRYWTTAEIRQLRELYTDMDNETLANALDRSLSSVQNLACKLGLRKSAAFIAGPYCRFQRGHATWNAGKSWNPPGSHATQFKRGHYGARQRPVGSERRTRDGIEIKIAEPSVWISKPRYVWEQHFGSIPVGTIIRLKDRNPENCAPENLQLITRTENMRLNYRPRRPRKSPVWTAPLFAEASA